MSTSSIRCQSSCGGLKQCSGDTFAQHEEFLALAFVQPWGRKMPPIVAFVGRCATGLLLLRSGGSIIQITYFAVVGKLRANLDPTQVWELWFYLGTVLFCVSFWRFRRVVAHGAR